MKESYRLILIDLGRRAKMLEENTEGLEPLVSLDQSARLEELKAWLDVCKKKSLQDSAEYFFGRMNELRSDGRIGLAPLAELQRRARLAELKAWEIRYQNAGSNFLSERLSKDLGREMKVHSATSFDRMSYL